MIKSSKVSIKNTNQVKLDDLNSFIDEYRNILSNFVDILWDLDKTPNLLPKEITSKVETWLSERAKQCAGKQASGIVRGTRKKQEKRQFVINKFVKNKDIKKARQLQLIFDKVKMSKPNINQVNPELDSRFVKINLDNDTSFDGWVTLGSLGNKLKIQIPFKKHKHFNKMLNNGTLKDGIRLSKNEITFMFELPEPIKKESGTTLGIDIGQTTTLSCSNGQMINEDNFGHTYSSICERLSRKTKGCELPKPKDFGFVVQQ